MDKNPDEFKRLNQQLEHLKRMVARYKQAEDWENFTSGDRVMVDNSDSTHDGAIGKFITHQWSSSGYVCLLVEFPDNSRHYYLPIHLLKQPIDSKPEPTPVKSSMPEPVEQVKTGIDFSQFTPQKLDEAANSFIESKLAQIAKMPLSTRKKVLIGTLPSELIETAIKLGVERGILPA